MPMYDEGSKVSPVKQHQVAEQMVDVEGSISTLHKLLDELEGRLSPLLRGVEDSKGDVTPPDLALVPLAEAMRSQRKAIGSASAKVQSILRRLEL